MGVIETLTAEATAHAGLGAAAGPLVPELLRLVAGGEGGLGGCIDRLHESGFGAQVTAWFSGAPAAPLAAADAEQIFGGDAVAALARSIGVARPAASGAIAALLPSALTTLAPGGILSQAAMAEVRPLLGPAVAPKPVVVSQPYGFAGTRSLDLPPLGGGPAIVQNPFRFALPIAVVMALAAAFWSLMVPHEKVVVPPAHFEPLYPPVK
jgi:uncharacterized protein YidB (DUF937 family)